MFTGRNIIAGLPEPLMKMVKFLNEKAEKGDFEFSDLLEKWADQEDVVDSLDFGLDNENAYYAVATAYIANEKNGQIDVPEGAHIWSWVYSLYLLAEVAEWEPGFIRRVIMSFADKQKDAEGMLGNVAQTYARHSFDHGLELMDGLERYRTGILAGLMENDFQKYCEVFPPMEHQNDFADAYCGALDLKKDVHEKAYDIAITFTDCALTSLMAFLLKEQLGLDGNRKVDCEKRICELLEGGNTEEYTRYICNWMLRVKDTTEFLEKLVLLLIEKLGKDSDSLTTIDSTIAAKHKNPDLLAKVIVKVAETMSPDDVLKMDHCLHRLNDDRENFVKLVLLFIVHTQGAYRKVGRQLWDQYHLDTTDFNPADFDESLQCVFAYFMLQDHGNPERRLPKVLPLLKTGSEKVKGFVMAILQPYTDDYMGHVRSALDRLNIKGKNAKTIKNYVEKRWDVIQKRRELKELAPEYTYGKEYREARRVEREFMQSQIKEAENGHKYLWQELARKVVLARGEGWRMPDGRTQKLPKIQFSAPAPLMNESQTPFEMRKWIGEIMKDWDDTTGNH